MGLRPWQLKSFISFAKTELNVHISSQTSDFPARTNPSVAYFESDRTSSCVTTRTSISTISSSNVSDSKDYSQFSIERLGRTNPTLPRREIIPTIRSSPSHLHPLPPIKSQILQPRHTNNTQPINVVTQILPVKKSPRFVIRENLVCARDYPARVVGDTLVVAAV
jgi:hypothetical protein